MHLLARHSSIVLICHFALFWILVDASAQSKAATNSHTEYVAAPFSLPTSDVGTTVGTLDITVTGTITDIDLQLSYEGSPTNALRFFSFNLISPNGTSIVLATGDQVGPGSLDGASLYETLFDDEAAGSINSGVVPYIGPHRPQGLLSSFDSESITGTWRLVVTKTTSAPGDVYWSLFVVGPVTRYVTTTGNNTGNDCTVEPNPCATIAYAVAQANPGDTLDIAAGTYNEPGLVIDKKLNIQGQGVLVQ